MYLFESHSEGDVPCRHRGDFDVLICKRQQETTHPLSDKEKVSCDFQIELRAQIMINEARVWVIFLGSTYVPLRLMLYTADCGFIEPE